MTNEGLLFPDGFLWGAATAAHQVEGNNVSNDWWAREHAADPDVAEPSGDACDSYHRYREDVGLLADAGLDTYRFSLEWSRIEPEQGFVSHAHIDHYRRMVAACHELGVTPVVTLLHFTVPRWFAAAGGWSSPDAACLFQRYTELCLPILGEGVEWVCTINEPGSPDPQVRETLAASHRAAREVLAAQSGMKSGWTVATQAFQPEPGCDAVAADYAFPREDCFLDAACGDDFVGVQAYTRTVIGPDGPRPVPAGAETTQMGWEYYPGALEAGVRNAWQRAGGTPVLVTENGIATADDGRRIAYTHAALEGLHRAMRDGVDVRGYLHWSLLDNYEWGTYRPTFGLVAVDRRTFARTPKPSLRWLGEVATANALAPVAANGR